MVSCPGTVSSGTQAPSPHPTPGSQCMPAAQLRGQTSRQTRADGSQHFPLPQAGACGSQVPPAGSQTPRAQVNPGGQGLRGSSQLEPPSSAHLGGSPVQIWPGEHCAFALQDPPAWTVTLKSTGAPPAIDCAVTCQGPSAAGVVTRNACALPPAPVCAMAVRYTPALQRAFATGGRVNEIVSPGMGAPVSASSSRTLRPTLEETPTRVAGVATMASLRRSATTLSLKATAPARRPGAVATTWNGPAAGRPAARKRAVAMPESSVVTSSASRLPPAGSPC